VSGYVGPLGSSLLSVSRPLLRPASARPLQSVQYAEYYQGTQATYVRTLENSCMSSHRILVVVASARRVLHALPSPSSSRVVQWEARRRYVGTFIWYEKGLIRTAFSASWFNNLNSIANPVSWVQDKLSPRPRQVEQSEVEAAKQEAARKGELGVFEMQEQEPDVPALKAAGSQEKATHVRPFMHFSTFVCVGWLTLPHGL
jgi:hypothetical protein